MRRDLKAEIYDSDATLESASRLTQQDKKITPANKQNIAQLVDDGKSRGLSFVRRNRLIGTL